MNEKLEKLWKKLDEEYPGFVVGDLNEWYSVDPEDEEYNGLWCSGESNSDWTNYWNEDYHPNKKDKKLLGFIAQEFETVFPSLVNESNIIGGNPEDFEKDEDGKSKKEPVMRKHIKQGTLIPILTKALQEAMTRIETLEAKVKALEDA